METVKSWWLFSLLSWCLSQRYRHLLYKHQWNTRWAFVQKPVIFTLENIMLFSHVKWSLLIWLHNNSRLSQRLLVKYLHSKRNFVSLRGHVISSIFSLPRLLLVTLALTSDSKILTLNTVQMKPFGRNLLIVLFDCLDVTKESYFLWTFLLLSQGYTSLKCWLQI